MTIIIKILTQKVFEANENKHLPIKIVTRFTTIRSTGICRSDQKIEPYRISWILGRINTELGKILNGLERLVRNSGLYII